MSSYNDLSFYYGKPCQSNAKENAKKSEKTKEMAGYHGYDPTVQHLMEEPRAVAK